MKINLGQFLHDVLGGAEKAVQGGVHAVEQGAHPAVQQMQQAYHHIFPQSPSVRQLGGAFINSQRHLVQSAESAPGAIVRTLGNPAQYSEEMAGLAHDTNPINAGIGALKNLVYLVHGNPAVNTAAKDYQYTPQFQNLVRHTAAFGTKPMPGAGADYVPLTDSMDLGGEGNDDTGITHELLHAVYAKKTPQQQQDFLKLAQSSITPQQRTMLKEQLAVPLYGGADLSDLTKLPPKLATEVHSFLPQYGSPAFGQGNKLARQLDRYYSQYFNTQRATTQHSDQYNAQTVGRRTGFKPVLSSRTEYLD